MRDAATLVPAEQCHHSMTASPSPGLWVSSRGTNTVCREVDRAEVMVFGPEDATIDEVVRFAQSLQPQDPGWVAERTRD